MSILGYSASYFLPEYWASTPLYGEKIIPLIDYILSTDFSQADKLANAFYNIEKKYKNTVDLPIDFIKEIIEESGYSYVLNLLGEDDDSIRLLTYLLVLIHQLKGTGLGIEVVLQLLRRGAEPMVLSVIGSPTLINREVSGFSANDYIYYRGLNLDSSSFDLTFPIRTFEYRTEQAIASIPGKLYLGINTNGYLVLSLSSKEHEGEWDIANRALSNIPLNPNSTYYVKLSYDGFEYDLKVSTDNKKFTDYKVITNNASTGVHNGTLYLGVDSNTTPISKPFEGYINLAPFAVDVQNVQITQWFETTPVGEENTFIVKADLDLALVSTNFFDNFATFCAKYVYPTLKAFDAKLKLTNNLTYIPYSKHRLTYVAMSDVQEEIETYMRDNYPLDSEFSYTSRGALQNKIITETIGDLDSLQEQEGD